MKPGRCVVVAVQCFAIEQNRRIDCLGRLVFWPLPVVLLPALQLSPDPLTLRLGQLSSLSPCVFPLCVLEELHIHSSALNTGRLTSSQA
jgi:hypothetical protein